MKVTRARKRVADEIREAVESRQGGDGTVEEVGAAVQNLAQARRSGDAMAARGAAVELSVAAGRYVARLDLASAGNPRYGK